MVASCAHCGYVTETSLRYCSSCGSLLRTGEWQPVDPWIGRTIEDRYRIVRRIQQGGMGTVYLAEHLRIGKDVALKIVEMKGDNSAFHRLEREARAVTLIGHDNIVSVLDFGETGDGRSAFMTMELLHGETLQERLKRVGKMPLDIVCSIVIQAAFAFEAAHDQGIIHRDIKPANIFLTNLHGRSDVVRILDFGIAALQDRAESFISTTALDLTQDAIVGTPEYLAPEQAMSDAVVDHRADIYSLGVTMYELLCGVSPFRGNGPIETVLRVLRDTPEPIAHYVPELPLLESVQRLMDQLINKDANLRLPSMRAFRSQLIGLRKLLKKPTRRKEELLDETRWNVRKSFSTWVHSSDQQTVVELSGVIDERADLSCLDSRIVGPEVVINLSRVARINSIGYQRWVDWLKSLKLAQFDVEIKECSPPMLYQANVNPEFFQGCLVRSFFAPYFCAHCGYEKHFLIDASDRATRVTLGKRPCEVCSSSMELDDVEHTYLSFFNYQRKSGRIAVKQVATSLDESGLLLLP